MRKILIPGLISFLPLLTNAHPGHGPNGGYTITHYFTEPQHQLLGVLTIAAVYFIVRAVSRKKAKG